MEKMEPKVEAAAGNAASTSEAAAEEAAALRDALRTLLPPRPQEAVTGGQDILAELGLARLRDAALAMKGARLYAKLNVPPPTPPVLHAPPG